MSRGFSGVRAATLVASHSVSHGRVDISDADFVRLLYRQTLLREATAAEVAFHVANRLSRPALAALFLNSPEFRMGTGPRLTAFLLCATLLQRSAGSGEVEARAEQIKSGAPLPELLPAFVDSPEFQALWN